MAEEQNNNQDKKYIKHYLNDVYTQDEAQQFLDAVNNDITSLNDGMKNVWEESSLMNTTIQEKEQLKQEAYSLLKKQEQEQKYTISISQRFIRKIATIAAAVVAIFTIGYGGVKYLNHKSSSNIIFAESTTLIGETQTVTLPDGTKVYLNACSYISYPQKFEGNERKITLIGEAYFQVARNEKQPFIVQTEQFDVKVLGTTFNIKAYKEDETQAVSVESGKVQVDMPEAMIRLIANEEMNYNINAGEYRKHKEEESVAVWRKGHFRFNQTPIMDVARELERAYNCKISIKEGQSFDNLITGEHSNENLENILKTIQYATGIKYNYDKNTNKILLYK